MVSKSNVYVRSVMFSMIDTITEWPIILAKPRCKSGEVTLSSRRR